MKNRLDLRWSDIVSLTMTPDEFLKKFRDKIEYNYKAYKPKKVILDNLNQLLKDKKEKLRILALGADWCPDCSKNVPHMIKIVKILKENNSDIEFKILYGIMLNALHKPGELIWHKSSSPPEAIDPKFNLKAIPTFYFFNSAGEFLGKIVENPKISSSLEEDSFEILKYYL
ncbi:MAG: thioredoxin family protein [Promethearchaeota archaeon]